MTKRKHWWLIVDKLDGWIVDGFLDKKTLELKMEEMHPVRRSRHEIIKVVRA